MPRSIAEKPFYQQMIHLLRCALGSLDELGRAEVVSFIASQQNVDGGFQDRAGKSDLYYSLFGGMLLRAAETLAVSRKPGKSLPENDSNRLLSSFLSNQSGVQVPGFIEKCCLVLLQMEFGINWVPRIRSAFSLTRSFWKDRQSINLSYRGFVLFLTLDSLFPIRQILKIGAREMLRRISIDQHSPCSEVAARVVLGKMMNMYSSEDANLLKSFACESGGFKAFAHLDNSDMLSTAVAFFALDFSGCDLRILKPACLDFIQQNYAEGAFLSGDGDPTRDLEYTFYGLLALGVLEE
jgi:prenyltransferase beta subunit